MSLTSRWPSIHPQETSSDIPSTSPSLTERRGVVIHRHRSWVIDGHVGRRLGRDRCIGVTPIGGSLCELAFSLGVPKTPLESLDSPPSADTGEDEEPTETHEDEAEVLVGSAHVHRARQIKHLAECGIMSLSVKLGFMGAVQDNGRFLWA